MTTTLFIFGQLSDLDIHWMARSGKRRRVPAGEAIIRKGAACDSLFVILEGRFSVTVDGAEAVSHMRVGDVAGEMSLVQQKLPAGTVTAVEDSQIFALRHQSLADKLHTDQGFAARFYRGISMLLSDRLARSNLVISRLKSVSGGQRPIWEIDEQVRKEAEAAEGTELDMEVLETIHLAGERFRRLQETCGSLDV